MQDCSTVTAWSEFYALHANDVSLILQKQHSHARSYPYQEASQEANQTPTPGAE